MNIIKLCYESEKYEFLHMAENEEDSFYSTRNMNYISINDKLCTIYKSERIIYFDKGFSASTLEGLKTIYPNHYIQLI